MTERVPLDTSAVIDLGTWTSDDLSSAVPVIASVTVAEPAFGLDPDDFAGLARFLPVVAV